jgi:alkanesulfonate monooxygenase SsuD/methylene tetrahydromethanopterin reductase-like flavin-dependent oxidoreductase (luciferase family)
LYDPDVGGQVFQSVMERLTLVEELGFDWVSISEHHYSARILSPSPIVMASHLAAHLHKLMIAVLGPIIPLNNPVRVAEELAMLDNLTQGRLVVGLLRGTTNEYLGLRRQARGGTRAHHRRHGADPQSLDGAASVRLGRLSLPVSDRLGLAASAAAAVSAHLRSGDEPRVL